MILIYINENENEELKQMKMKIIRYGSEGGGGVVSIQSFFVEKNILRTVTPNSHLREEHSYEHSLNSALNSASLDLLLSITFEISCKLRYVLCYKFLSRIVIV